MKNFDGDVYIPKDLLEEIVRIPVINADEEDEFWIGEILICYAALSQKNNRKPTPEELSDFTHSPINIVRNIIVEYDAKGWLDRLDVKEEELEHDKSRNLNLTESNLERHE